MRQQPRCGCTASAGGWHEAWRASSSDAVRARGWAGPPSDPLTSVEQSRATQPITAETTLPTAVHSSVDSRVMKAIAHPLRHRILAILNERIASPKEIADELGERLPNVSYHVKTLDELGAIELVDTQPRRG